MTYICSSDCIIGWCCKCLFGCSRNFNSSFYTTMLSTTFDCPF
ncbi:unnamed protein product [Onchocerca flexuosa]|uniref:Uncharacterized protein n=1 Tax=Onchocerca flexuosa TaxID=387005 RepID=A0A183HC04_9BILA|nr:unnamed protein product [Onchocerca flexuosa]